VPIASRHALASAAVQLLDGFFDPGGGWAVISRFTHVLVGLTWVGLLYFFNVVQAPAFAELSDGARGEALRTVTARALRWFRWASVLTVAFGLLLVVGKGDGEQIGEYMRSSQGYAISTGMLLGVVMFVNVWAVIWPAQQVVIASATVVAGGGAADSEAPTAARRAARASRVNALFSIPMLWFMVFTAHLAAIYDPPVNKGAYLGGVIAVVAVLQLSALGRLGGLDNAVNRVLLDDHRRTIAAGFVVLVLFQALYELVLT